MLEFHMKNNSLHARTSLLDFPAWTRLFCAPAVCLILGIVVSPKFLVLALVYVLVSARLIYSYVRLVLQKKSISDEDESLRWRGLHHGDVDSTLELHKSLTINFALLAICLWIYEHSRVLCSPKNGGSGDDEHAVVHRAFNMARNLVKIEYVLGLAIEPGAQAFFWNQFPWVISVANVYYGIFHFVVPTSVAARLIIYKQDPYFKYPIGFFLMCFLALILFAFVPTMPPRLLPSYKFAYLDTNKTHISQEDAHMLQPWWNIIDTMKQGETLYDKLHKEGGNPYAALPSMHTGWALWSCLTWIGTIHEDAPSWLNNLELFFHKVSEMRVLIVFKHLFFV